MQQIALIHHMTRRDDTCPYDENHHATMVAKPGESKREFYDRVLQQTVKFNEPIPTGASEHFIHHIYEGHGIWIEDIVK